MLLPIVLWGSKPPSHTVNTVFLSRDDRTLVTGSCEGQLLVYNVYAKDIVPKCMLIGHTSSVCSIKQLSLGLHDLHVVSASIEGEIYKWNVTDGAYLKCKALQGPLQSLKVLPSSQNILVCGQYGAMHILDPINLDVKHVLVAFDPTHWILCYTIFQPPKTKDEEVVSLTINGYVKTWHLPDNLQEKTITETENKPLTCTDPVMITYNPKSLYNCMIVCKTEWRIYRGGDFVLLLTDTSQQGSRWMGGRFYQTNNVILWTEAGTVYIYKLPSRAIRPVDHTDTTWAAEPASCLYSFSTGDTPLCKFLYRQSLRTVHIYLVRGEEGGDIKLWKFEKDADVAKQGIGKSINCSLNETWRTNPPSIAREECERCGTPCDVTASVSLEPLNYVACGFSNGTIVIGKIAKMAIHSLSSLGGGAEYKRLYGHKDNVCTLSFPHFISPTVYSSSVLYSGGKDFSVKIWDWKKTQLLQSFTIHAGFVTKFLLPPTNATGRLKGSMVSVCEGNIVAVTKPTNASPLFYGTCHHAPIQEIRWRMSEDIVLVYCSDDTVYIWGLSTGHLDRIETGHVALNIISADSTPCQELKSILNISPPGTTYPKQTSGLSIVPFQFRRKDTFGHIIVFDTELLLHLVSQIQGSFYDEGVDDTIKSSKNPTMNFDMLKKKVAQRGAELRFTHERRSSIITQTETAKLLDERSVSLPLDDNLKAEEEKDEGKVKSSSNNLPNGIPSQHGDTLASDRISAIKETCTLLLSGLHAWGVDENIDSTCLKHLGMFSPSKEVSYGTVSSNFTFMLMLPGWEKRAEAQSGGTLFYPYGRWCISSTMTTQHLLSVSALANKQMSTDLTLSFNQHIRAVSLKRVSDNATEREELLRQSINESEKKAGWSHVTALHCIVLPEHVPSSYCSPQLSHLALKWQDRCMEVREAAQALFLRELRRIGFSGRQQLVNQWYPYVVRKRDINPPEPLEKIFNVELPAISKFYRTLINIPTKSVSSVSLDDEDTPNDHFAVSVIILGVIVSEFNDEVELNNVRPHITSPDKLEAIKARQPKKSGFLLTYDMLKMLSFALFSQLTQPPSILPLHSPLRRAVVDLIGRGYSVWGDFMNLTAVIMALIELQTDPLVPIETKKAIAQSGSLPGTGNKVRLAAAATVRAAYQASILIANNKPQHTINSLSKEILTFKCDVEAGLTVQSLSPFPSSYHTVLDKGRYPIYLLVQNVIEKSKQKDLSPILVKIIEIILFCIDIEQFKTRSLSDLVPSLTRNPMVDYCSSTQQVAVGSAEGLVHIFDIRAGKCTPLHAHSGPTSAVTMSPNGRTLLTYSEREGKVTIWQSSSGILSLMSNSTALRLIRTVDLQPQIVFSNNYHNTSYFKWEGTRSVSLHQLDGTKKLFTV